MSNDVIYDGWSYLAHNCVLTNIDPLTPAPVTNQTSTLANRNGSQLIQSNYGAKPIAVEGYYTGTTPADAQAMYDSMMSMLHRIERPLIVPHAGGTRTYIATPSTISIQEPQGLNKLTFSILYTVSAGVSVDSVITTLVDTIITTSTSNQSLIAGGSAICRPLITLTFTSVSGGTGKIVTIRNGADLTGLSFSRDFVSGDTITIDSTQMQIYVNGVLTEPDGRLPVWMPGGGSLIYSDSFTTRTVRLLMQHNERNL